jgi:hypothetical protein
MVILTCRRSPACRGLGANAPQVLQLTAELIPNQLRFPATPTLHLPAAHLPNRFRAKPHPARSLRLLEAISEVARSRTADCSDLHGPRTASVGTGSAGAGKGIERVIDAMGSLRQFELVVSVESSGTGGCDAARSTFTCCPCQGVTFDSTESPLTPGGPAGTVLGAFPPVIH